MQRQILHKIRAKHSQCIYERFGNGDFATFELFIVDSDVNGRPEAAVQIEGPVAPAYIGEVNAHGNRSWGEGETDAVSNDGRTVKRKTTMGGLIQKSMEKWPKYMMEKKHNFQKEGLLHYSFHLDYTHSGESEDAIAAREQKKDEQMAERERRKAETGSVEEAHTIAQVIPEWIQPHEWTRRIIAPGWYRMCVHADNYISVEMDIRSSAGRGGVDKETGHVFTHQKREELLEVARIMGLENRELSAIEMEEKQVAEELEKALKNQVRDDDMDATRNLMKEVGGLVAKMQTKQQDSFHRLKFQEGYTKRNHNKILYSGMVVTGLFLVITLFQVYTLRKWLLSNSVLGR